MMSKISRIGLLCATLAAVGLSAPAFAETKIMTKAECDRVQVYFGQQASCKSCDFSKQYFGIDGNKQFSCRKKK